MNPQLLMQLLSQLQQGGGGGFYGSSFLPQGMDPNGQMQPSTMNQAAAGPNLMQGYDLYQQQRGAWRSPMDNSSAGGVDPFTGVSRGPSAYGGDPSQQGPGMMMNRMRQMQGGGAAPGGWSPPGYGAQPGGGYSGGGYGGGWGDIVGRHMMQRQQQMNMPRQQPFAQTRQQQYPGAAPTA